jgi:hypothetical protein
MLKLNQGLSNGLKKKGLGPRRGLTQNDEGTGVGCSHMAPSLQRYSLVFLRNFCFNGKVVIIHRKMLKKKVAMIPRKI